MSKQIERPRNPTKEQGIEEQKSQLQKEAPTEPPHDSIKEQESQLEKETPTPSTDRGIEFPLPSIWHLLFLNGSAATVAGFLLIKRMGFEWVLVANWFSAFICFILAFFAFRDARPRRLLAILAVISLSCEGVVFYYDTYLRTSIGIAWPTEVSSNEALIGGPLSNLDSADTVIKIYVCVVTVRGSECYLDMHSQTPKIGDRHWYGLARLGNEHLENDPRDLTFFVVVAGVEADKLSQIPGASESKTIPNLATGLIRQLSENPVVRAVAGPFRIRKTHIGSPAAQFTAITEENVPNRISIPPLRQPNYSVCPPVVITWVGPAGTPAAAAVEAWQDGRKHGALDSAFKYRIKKWPSGVERINVKISSRPGSGPYDTVWLKRGVCP